MTQRAKSGLALALASVFSTAGLAAMSQDVLDIPANPGAPEYKSSIISASDNTFLTKAAQGNMAEIKLGQLAEERGSSDTVRQIGKRLVKDHTQLQKQLQGIAKAKRVDWPTEMNWKQDATYRELSNLRGEEFDRAFLRHMEANHEKTIKMYRETFNYGDNREVRRYAGQTLPIIREHYRALHDTSKR